MDHRGYSAAEEPVGITLQEAQESISKSHVEVHLGFLHGIINRMASNSSNCKAWCITTVSAILVISAQENGPSATWLALVPIISFGALDIYYLGLEKAFRNSHDIFVHHLHSGTLRPGELFKVTPIGEDSSLRSSALRSPSIYIFYGSVLAIVAVSQCMLN